MKVRRLVVLWASPEDGTRFTIGELWKEPGGFYAFAYSDDLDGAKAKGFALLPAFPEPRTSSAPYRAASLFPTFAQRVPSPRRPDFGAFIEAWGLRKDDEPLDMLAVSGGVQMTDRLELAEHRPKGDDLSRPLVIRVAGQKHYDGASDARVGDVLALRRDPENKFDSDATILLVANGKTLGFVPRQYSRVVAALLDAGVALEAVAIRQLHVPHDPLRWVVRLSRR